MTEPMSALTHCECGRQHEWASDGPLSVACECGATVSAPPITVAIPLPLLARLIRAARQAWAMLLLHGDDGDRDEAGGAVDAAIEAELLIDEQVGQ